MKKSGFVILFILLLSSCNKIKIMEENNHENPIIVNKALNDSDNDAIKKLIHFNHIKKASIDCLIKKYPPLWDKTFILGKKDGFITEFRAGLFKFFTQKQIKSRDIKIREVTWASNKEENLTVWFEEKDDKWIPVEHSIWNKRAVF
ncbi:hypothetical protein A9G40_11795 [Gilliamella sp. Nev3-1]|nr:hypothetical protein A9G40_11795 [Gilliamella apicola]